MGMLLAALTIASALVLVLYVYCKLLDLPPWPDKPDAQDEGQKTAGGCNS